MPPCVMNPTDAFTCGALTKAIPLWITCIMLRRPCWLAAGVSPEAGFSRAGVNSAPLHFARRWCRPGSPPATAAAEHGRDQAAACTGTLSISSLAETICSVNFEAVASVLSVSDSGAHRQDLCLRMFESGKASDQLVPMRCSHCSLWIPIAKSAGITSDFPLEHRGLAQQQLSLLSHSWRSCGDKLRCTGTRADEDARC